MYEDEKGSKQYAEEQNDSIEKENAARELEIIAKELIELRRKEFNLQLRKNELIDILK